jgi:hypothetical protein
MPKPKDPDAGHEEREQKARVEHMRHGHQRQGNEPERPPDRPEDADRPRRRRMGRDHIVHQQIVDSRLSGGAPATPEAYAEGLKEWQQLPGAVVRPATDEKPQEKQLPQVNEKDQQKEE